MEKRDFKRPRFTLDRSRRGNLTEQIAAGLRTAIETGYYRPGDILPPVRDLAQILGVSMGIAVQAVNRIREAGLISPRPAVGSVVCAKDRPLWKGQVLIVVPSGIGNPSGNAAYAVLRDTLTANGYLPLTATVLRTPDGKFDFSLLETVMRQQLDLVVQLHDQPEIARWLSRKGVPFIRFTQKALRLANCVGNVVRRDDLAVSDFLAHCRREEVSRVLQVAAWSSGLDVAPPLKRLGIDVETWRVPLLKNECTGYALAKWAAETFAEWLTRNGKDRLPDVIFFRDDHLTTGALLAFATAGIRIPEDVRIVTWSNRDYGPVSLFPVTRMEMDVAAQGRALAEHVLTYLRTGNCPAEVTVGPTYIPAESNQIETIAKLPIKHHTKSAKCAKFFQGGKLGELRELGVRQKEGLAIGSDCHVSKRRKQMKMQEITENGGMNIRSSIGRVALVATAFAALTAAFSASAITQAEWEADNSLIPDPASGAFYVVSPAARTGEQTVDADMDGLDATPTERSYDFPFGTSLSTCKPGFIVVIK